MGWENASERHSVRGHHHESYFYSDSFSSNLNATT